ncbi:MAG TPA: deoxyribonuclease IV [Dehalococcoidia bacterium]|nr:deoxyribonuclease IV [Dehalococcoidia bacterium]
MADQGTLREEPKLRIGAHVSASGGVDKAIERAQAIGAETIQIFGASPQAWRRKEYGAVEIEAFKSKSQSTDIGPAFLHGVYLINLATSNPENLAKSIDALIHDMKVCHVIGARGVIFHLGSHRGSGFQQVLSQIAESVHVVLENTPEDSWLILENSAGMGDAVGSRFSELAAVMAAAGDGRVKVCLDTQHMFASGYDVRSKDGLEAALSEFDSEVGLERLVAVHANDSKCPLAGGVDRHENIGEGYIGREGFEVIMSHPAFADVPFLLEVPGFENQGPDKANIDILKGIRALTAGAKR